MGIDLRTPVGVLFSALGVLLAAYGAATRGQPGTEPTGLPVDLIWGLVLLGFGLVMLALARRARRLGASPRGP
jgi:formate hydrogenlyase subunit 3/multisubunit Na+/H+ antiporter MnhD subunit